MLIPDLFNSLQLIILDLLSVFGLRDLNPFLVLQLVIDAMTKNRPGMVDDLLPSRPHLICRPFLSISKEILSQGTAQPLVIII